MADQKKPSSRPQKPRPTQRRTPHGQPPPFNRSRRPTNRPTSNSRPAPRPQQAVEQTEAERDEVEVIEMPNLDPPEYVVVAQIAAPFGLRGAVKATIQTDFPDRFELLEKVYLSPPGISPNQEREERPLMSARLQNDKQVVLRFAGVNKVEQAETLRGYSVSIPVGEVMPLPEGEYYIFQIIGMEVYSTADEYVGTVVNVERLPANDVYSVRGPLSKKDVLIPAVKDVVKQIDLETNRITIELLEGLI